ncbi:MAG: hypothetical protein K0S54_1114 [Alphaproteobacteria bacterium]|nr:hypothetical protein [Alphaproteobacteria bacterium]
MDPATTAILRDCTQASDASTMIFPQVLARLAAANVERYHADLARAEKTYYLPNGASHTVPCHRLDTPIAATFCAGAVDAAVRASQAGAITYREFCRRIAQAGCVFYLVSLAGKRAVYYGRCGEAHVEPFPQT